MKLHTPIVIKFNKHSINIALYKRMSQFRVISVQYLAAFLSLLCV